MVATAKILKSSRPTLFIVKAFFYFESTGATSRRTSTGEKGKFLSTEIHRPLINTSRS